MDVINKLPNPFELFMKKDEKEKNIENFNTSNDDITPKPTSSVSNQPKKVSPKYFVWFIILIFIILFFILAFMYYIYEITILPSILNNIYTTEVSNPQVIPLFNKIIGVQFTSGRLSIFICLWVVIYLLNLLIGDVIFKMNDPLNIFYITTLFVFGIVGTTFIIIGNITSLVEVFENTFGFYLINSFMYKLSKFTKIFKSKYFPNFDIPYEILITRFDIASFHDILSSLTQKNGPQENQDELSNDFYIDFSNLELSEEDIKNGLLKLVFVKNNAGHFTWAFIASVIAILLSMNAISK